MKSIADANVLLPLLCEGHVAQKAARDWFDRKVASSVVWCLLTRLAILRLLTNPHVMGTDVQSPFSALEAWESLEQDERMEELDAIPSDHERIFRNFASRGQSEPNVWTDAWLAALAEANGCEMVTFDLGFKRFPLSRVQILAAS
jgi:toxin-antitoxin system PIN domain toxin